jgi:uncharacterized circularly permuted ATP-grasp superfamily protein
MDPIAGWHAAVLPEEEFAPARLRELSAQMAARRLTFGSRLLCPFLRPFFLSPDDEARMRQAAEAIASAGEKVVRAALDSPALFAELGMTDAEARLARIDPGYDTASTASRLDAFLLPDALHFAEYNAESPAGPGYTQRLSELFDTLPAMARFKAGHRVHYHRTIPALLDALLASYRQWGGRAQPPAIAIVDWREVPTWSEFEILRDAFVEAGVPTVIADPRDLAFDGRALTAPGGVHIDLVYRRVLINDIVARPDECDALVRAYEARTVCMANTLRCKIAHKKAFFAVITDARQAPLFTDGERAAIAAHVPWTRVVRDEATDKGGCRVSLLELARGERERLVLKPNDEYGGKGIVLGWEADERQWASSLDAALADPPGTWIVQERIPVRREVFPQFDVEGRVTMRDMLVDFAPYLFRGRMTGYLTRLSATGLANVTSGGGQVPAFVVE